MPVHPLQRPNRRDEAPDLEKDNSEVEGSAEQKKKEEEEGEMSTEQMLRVLVVMQCTAVVMFAAMPRSVERDN